MQSSPIEGKTWLTSRDIQALLGISRSTFYRMLATGKLPKPTIHPMSRTQRWHTLAINEAIRRWITEAGGDHEKE